MTTPTTGPEKIYALLGITLEAPLQAGSGWSLVPADGLLAVLAEYDADRFVGQTAGGDLADPHCSPDVVVVPLPKGAEVPVKPGCVAAGGGASARDFATRAREWLQRLLR